MKNKDVGALSLCRNSKRTATVDFLTRKSTIHNSPLLKRKIFLYQNNKTTLGENIFPNFVVQCMMIPTITTNLYPEIGLAKLLKH